MRVHLLRDYSNGIHNYRSSIHLEIIVKKTAKIDEGQSQHGYSNTIISIRIYMHQ